jgi:hypothetical protein
MPFAYRGMKSLLVIKKLKSVIAQGESGFQFLFKPCLGYTHGILINPAKKGFKQIFSIRIAQLGL